MQYSQWGNSKWLESGGKSCCQLFPHHQGVHWLNRRGYRFFVSLSHRHCPRAPAKHASLYHLQTPALVLHSPMPHLPSVFPLMRQATVPCYQPYLLPLHHSGEEAHHCRPQLLSFPLLPHCHQRYHSHQLKHPQLPDLSLAQFLLGPHLLQVLQPFLDHLEHSDKFHSAAPTTGEKLCTHLWCSS